MHYLYILKSTANRRLYIGYTADLKGRLAQHNSGNSRATKAGKPYELVYYEAYRAKSDALKRERQLKQFKQAYTRLKQRLIASSAEQN